ncbi:MAG: TRAM domain-containing protein, partial [Oscillospiraceae bacterium]|nr:TRAM domain-containing protein [Oscillospiraceae bacterium]
ASLVGQTLRVLVEQQTQQGTHCVLRGRAESNAVVEFRGKAELVGQFCFVTIIGAERTALRGVMAEKQRCNPT